MNLQESIKYFTADELNKIFKVLEKRVRRAETDFEERTAVRNRSMFQMMYYCALRVSELEMLLVEDYNPVHNNMYCRRLKDGINNTLQIVDKKILSDLKKHFRLNKPEHHIFESKSGVAVSRKTMDKILKQVCSEAKLTTPDKWHCHTFRHTRAIDLLEGGISIYEVQYWLGHVNIQNTEIYLRFTTNQYKALFDKLKDQHGIYDPEKE